MSDREYWKKQQKTQPLFSSLAWSRPEQRASAGKLLLVGGTAQGFASLALAYSVAEQEGAGVIQTLLPDSLRSVVGSHLFEAQFGSSNPSGSLSQEALGQLLDLASWADAVIFPGDFSHNSDTTILLEKFLQKSRSKVTLTKEALHTSFNHAALVCERADTLLVVSLADWQRLVKELRWHQAVQYDRPLLVLIDHLHEITQSIAAHILLYHHGQIIVASKGMVSTTPYEFHDTLRWRTEIATKATVWWLQHPQKSFEALTTAVAELKQ